MSELTDRGANRAVAIALQRDNAALRQEIERLQATLARVQGELKQSVDDNFSLVEQLQRADAKCTESFTSRCDRCGTDNTFMIAADTEREERLRERLAQAEQERDRLRAGLDEIRKKSYEPDPERPALSTRQEIQLLAEQALGSLSTDPPQNPLKS